MADQELIPAVQVTSGEKFVNERGITAIKDGIKASNAGTERLRKPDWLRIRIKGGATYEKVGRVVKTPFGVIAERVVRSGLG